MPLVHLHNKITISNLCKYILVATKVLKNELMYNAMQNNKQNTIKYNTLKHNAIQHNECMRIP